MHVVVNSTHHVSLGSVKYKVIKASEKVVEGLGNVLLAENAPVEVGNQARDELPLGIMPVHGKHNRQFRHSAFIGSESQFAQQNLKYSPFNIK